MSQKGPCILIVDDEKDILNRLENALTQDSYEIYTSESGQEALEKVVQYPIDLLVLDVMLPGISGLEVCKCVREQVSNYLPIIIISGAGNEGDKVKALGLGANEYMTKPFDMSIFLARVKAHLHNHQPIEPVFTAGPLKVDFLHYRVQVNGHEVQLGPTEHQILKILIDNKGKLITQDSLIHKLWPGEDNLNTEVGVHSWREQEIVTSIHNLRRKIEHPTQCRFIITHHHMGYRFKTEDESGNYGAKEQ